MKKAYFDFYDCMINAETGEILDMCKCSADVDCMYKQRWLADGSPSHVSSNDPRWI